MSDRISTIDFSEIAFRLRKEKKWNEQRINTAILEYKKFLERAHKDSSISPSFDVDEVWHAHILHTKQYRDDCQRIFGYFLDHTPTRATTESNKALCVATKTSALCIATKSPVALCIATRVRTSKLDAR